MDMEIEDVLLENGPQKDLPAFMAPPTVLNEEQVPADPSIVAAPAAAPVPRQAAKGRLSRTQRKNRRAREHRRQLFDQLAAAVELAGGQAVVPQKWARNHATTAVDPMAGGQENAPMLVARAAVPVPGARIPTEPDPLPLRRVYGARVRPNQARPNAQSLFAQAWRELITARSIDAAMGIIQYYRYDVLTIVSVVSRERECHSNNIFYAHKISGL